MKKIQQRFAENAKRVNLYSIPIVRQKGTEKKQHSIEAVVSMGGRKIL
ncbi:MAG: hypothetical protein IKP00_05425 [Victivallales bacterium]|nr:hypothetical protein [Victivallales bacterium]